MAFRSSDPSVVEVFPTGFFRAHARGTATVTAEVQGKSSTVEVRVVDPASSAFSIEVRVSGDTSALPADELRRAIARWTRVVVGGAPPQAVSLPAGSCAPWAPAIEETVDHLLVLAHVTQMDGTGGIVAGSGACAVREGSRQPVVSTLELDASDLRSTALAAVLQSTLQHELGHALGFASTWFTPKPSLVQIWPELFSYSYLGESARVAATRWGAIATPDEPLWLENRGGPGSAASHWSEQVVGSRELMTAFTTGTTLSIVTVGALRDLGYTVDETGADWTYAPAATGPLAALVTSHTEDSRAERVTTPQFILGADGRPTASSRP